jgi:uncharacterized phage protein (TIGR01671 family)
MYRGWMDGRRDSTFISRIKMRELKFRAWDSETDMMYKIVSLNVRRNGTVSGSIWRKELKGREGRTIQNPPIMQFTGLQDKNGKEIYEGDIVKVWHEGDFEDKYMKGVVEYSTASCGYFIDYSKRGVQIMMKKYEEFEVIGNIYENPDLT